jgi:hypothetical protein
LLLGVHTPESWARAVLAAGLRVLMTMKEGMEPKATAASVPLDAKLTVFFRQNDKVGAVLEFEGQTFAVEV